jgi:hypothetical protein
MARQFSSTFVLHVVCYLNLCALEKHEVEMCMPFFVIDQPNESLTKLSLLPYFKTCNPFAHFICIIFYLEVFLAIMQ